MLGSQEVNGLPCACLVVDGANFFMGCKQLEKQTKRKLWIDEKMLSTLLQYLESKIGMPISEKHFFTAEKSK